MRYSRSAHERIGDAGNGTGCSQRERSDPPETPHRLWRGGREISLGHDEIGAALEALDELGQVLGLIGEIGLEGDHRVAARIACSRRHRAGQRIQRGVVPFVLAPVENGQREDVGVRLQRLLRRVGAAVIVDQNLILAGVFLKHLSNTPQEHANGLRFVVCGDTDVQHESSGDAGGPSSES